MILTVFRNNGLFDFKRSSKSLFERSENVNMVDAVPEDTSLGAVLCGCPGPEQSQEQTHRPAHTVYLLRLMGNGMIHHYNFYMLPFILFETYIFQVLMGLHVAQNLL